MSGVGVGRIAGILALGVAGLAGWSGDGEAQANRLDLSARGGMAVPVGNLGQVAQPGYGLGTGIAYPLGSGIRLRTDVEFFYFPGEPAKSELYRPADVTQWFLFLGADVDLAPRTSPWGVRAQVGAGASLLGTDPLPLPFGTSTPFVQLDRELFAWHAGVTADYALNSSFAPFLRVRGLFTRGGGSVAAFRGIDADVGDAGLFVSIPLEAGFTVSF
jgi:hypothetical protein